MQIELSTPATSDVMFERKQDLLQNRNLSLSFDLRTVDGLNVSTWLDKLLQAARILNLTETEWYFVEDGDEGPFSPRNEIEALRGLELKFRGICHSALSSNSYSNSITAELHKKVVSMLEALPHDRPSLTGKSSRGSGKAGEAEARLVAWAAEQGVKSLIEPAVFEGTGRGGAALSTIEVGDIVLEIPAEVIISEKVALASDMGAVLKGAPDLNDETVAFLWSMRERHERDSKFAPFFASLPESFHTGLGFGLAGLKSLEGTLVLEGIIRAREHLRSQYDSLFPGLSDKYPDLFPKESYSWENFLWACELWYSYGIKVQFPDGSIQTCLVPMASLLNHAVVPHVTHFSRVNEKTNSLQLYALRQCKAGEQCYISYGPIQNSDLLTFYGFLVEDNPSDVIPIEMDIHSICHDPRQIFLINNYNVLDSHMLREKKGLPSRLIAALRVACMEGEEFQSYSADPRMQMVSARNERDVYSSLLATVDALLEPLTTPESTFGEVDTGNDWDVLLAEQYKQDLLNILQSLRGFVVTALNGTPCDSNATNLLNELNQGAL